MLPMMKCEQAFYIKVYLLYQYSLYLCVEKYNAFVTKVVIVQYHMRS